MKWIILIISSATMFAQTIRPSNIVTTSAAKTNLFSGPVTGNYSGVFTNTQMNEFMQSILNGANAQTEYQAAQGSQTSTDAMTGAIAVPSSSSVHQSNAVAGYINNSSTSTNPVGGYFQCRSLISSQPCWGLNSLALSTSTHPTMLIGYENDVNATNTGDTGYAFGAGGFWTAAASNINAYQATEPSGSSGGQWNTGFLAATACCSNAVVVGATSSVNNSPSMPISFQNVDAGGVVRTSFITTDAAGNFQFAPFSGIGKLGGLTIPQIITTTLTTTGATTDNVTVTGMVATGHCSLTPTNSGAAGGIASVYVSAKTTNQITVTHTATSGWTFDVICFPQ